MPGHRGRETGWGSSSSGRGRIGFGGEADATAAHSKTAETMDLLLLRNPDEHEEDNDTPKDEL
jgi:hypothetical protein